MPVYGGDSTLYDLLEKQASVAKATAQEFSALLQGNADPHSVAKSLKDLEADGDKATHAVNHLANEQFITPFDKEDVYSLSGALDDVTDMIEAAGARIALYKLKDGRGEIGPIGELMVTTVNAMAEAVHGLRHLKKQKEFAQSLSHIHELENQTDTAYREALGRIFGPTSPDAIEVIKMKDVIDHIEIAADKCEDVATFLEKISVKYA